MTAVWIVAQRGLALAGLVVLAPLLGALAVAVRLDSPGPALHRAVRSSRGRPFTILKLRTMCNDSAVVGSGITAAGDPRVTRLGHLLRRTKLDELPQLWNVVQGNMLLVGPRPEDPRYANMADPLHREVLGATPGITGPTALAWHDEEERLAVAALDLARDEGRAAATVDDVERAYRERILPQKLAMDAAYLRTRTARGDLAILGRTIGAVIRRTGGR